MRTTHIGTMTKHLCLLLAACAFPALVFSATPMGVSQHAYTPTLAVDTLEKQLGWVENKQYQCGGYYLDTSFALPVTTTNKNLVAITGNQGLLSLHGMSTLEGKVSVTRQGQQITAKKAFLYRDPNTGKLSSIELMGNVHLREPNTLIVAKEGKYNFETGHKALYNILYRTSVNGRQIVGPKKVPEAATRTDRIVTATTAWGKADEFSQTEPKIYELSGASFSTCPPESPAWKLKAGHIVLDKNSGRGYATNTVIQVKGIPIFYTPYINFPIDSRRKTGFLWPTIGAKNSWGPYALVPFYWNLAPNYDTTITLGVLTKRGMQLSDNFRYLSPINSGNINITLLPSDSQFAFQQTAYKEKYSSNTNPTVEAELSRLLNSSTTRRSLLWRDDAHYNNHWSSHVDFSYAGDDYYLQDFGSSLNEITLNQLLQEADLYYKSDNWNFTGRLQAYQTLHPLLQGQNPVANQYRRFPQLILNGDYPDQPYGLEYFISNEATHFDIRNTPGAAASQTTATLQNPAKQPIGNRLHTQPGISLPLNWPYFYINPRIQLALTHYDMYQTTPTGAPDIKRRGIPIFDVAAGSSFIRNFSLFSHAFEQTLEPQIYYTYIPYRNQASIPIFDTTVSTLTYDQLFNYNRFSGIDRIGDANQVGAGLTTRFIDQETGLEKVRLGVGEIAYFSRRKVTLCNNTSCPDNPFNPENHRRLSPISGVLDYHVNASWKFTSNVIWNPTTKQLDNSSTGFHYQPDEEHIFNIGYNFVRNGDPLSGITAINSSQNNLKNTDLSAAWPLIRDFSAVGRWTQAWNTNHLQNLLYGIQYDTCCWAARFVGGRVFIGPNPDNNQTLQYSNQFYLQFSLKGLGDIGSGGSPESLLSSINGYKSHFGQEL